ncbi:MAG: hypothetical protein LBV45_01685 [Xanthomonadaceae bacterium]|jgi:hypothetical protein|nr:hypothetical protein [Xanthomonadaceae bacterium]
MKSSCLVMFLVIGMLFSANVSSADQADDEDSPVASAMMLYLMFAEPEACAQLYPELRTNVDLLRSRFSAQVSGGRSTDSSLPISQQQEVAACMGGRPAMSKHECNRLTTLLATAAGDDDMNESSIVEMESLIKRGRAMLGRCPDDKERELNRKYGVN